MTTDKRILWLTPDKPEDISVGRRRIADHLEEQGFSVTLRGTTPRTLLLSMGERGAYDVIIGTTRAGAVAGVLLKGLHRRPLIVDHIDPISQFETTHPRWLAVLVRHLENAAFRLADHVLYTYEEERARVESHATSLSRTDLGVEFDQFADPDDQSIATARKRLQGVSTQENIALYIGGLEPIYNIEALLTAFESLEEWSLVVIGDGSLRESVEQAAQRRENIHYLGTVSHDLVAGFTAEADVGINLVDDAHTLKVLEYGAAGLPTVQVEGAAEERFGELVTYCSLDPGSIADAIRRSSEQDATRLQSFVDDYDWADISEDYARAITSVK